MDTPKKPIIVTQVIILKEQPLDSVLADLFTFFMMFVLIWANHRWLGGSWIIDFMMILIALIAAAGMSSQRKFTFNSRGDAIKFLENGE